MRIFKPTEIEIPFESFSSARLENPREEKVKKNKIEEEV